MHVLLILHTVPNTGFEAQIGAVDFLSRGKPLCSCLVIVSFIFNQIETCRVQSHAQQCRQNTAAYAQMGGCGIKVGSAS